MIGISGRRLTLQYAELLHLRKAVKEAELRAGVPAQNLGPNLNKESRPQ